MPDIKVANLEDESSLLEIFHELLMDEMFQYIVDKMNSHTENYQQHVRSGYGSDWRQNQSSACSAETDGHCKETSPSVILETRSSHVDTFLSENDVTWSIFGVSSNSTFQLRLELRWQAAQNTSYHWRCDWKFQNGVCPNTGHLYRQEFVEIQAKSLIQKLQPNQMRSLLSQVL